MKYEQEEKYFLNISGEYGVYEELVKQ